MFHIKNAIQIQWKNIPRNIKAIIYKYFKSIQKYFYISGKANPA